MRVLHYTLGFPPYRSGGLTKYALDLMVAEQALGLDVCALYPGSISLVKSKCTVIKKGDYQGIQKFEIVNPLPVPLLYGVRKTKKIYDEHGIDLQGFVDLLDVFRPDVFHVHTLMGLPKVFLEQIKKRCIKVVFTSHDYYGLCPRATFVDNYGEVCDNKRGECFCERCNSKAHSTIFLRIRSMKSILFLAKYIKSRMQ